MGEVFLPELFQYNCISLLHPCLRIFSSTVLGSKGINLMCSNTTVHIFFMIYDEYFLIYPNALEHSILNYSEGPMKRKCFCCLLQVFVAREQNTYKKVRTNWTKAGIWTRTAHTKEQFFKILNNCTYKMKNGLWLHLTSKLKCTTLQKSSNGI